MSLPAKSDRSNYAEGELIRNYDLSSGRADPWVVSTEKGSEAAAQVATTPLPCASVAEITVDSGGFYPSSVQLYQPGIALTEGKRYEVSFWARSKAPQTMEVAVMPSGFAKPGASFGLRQDVNLTPDWKRCSYTFEATITTTSSRLGFGVGLEPGTYSLGNISLKEVESGRELLKDGDLKKVRESGPWILGNASRSRAIELLAPEEHALRLSVGKSSAKGDRVSLCQDHVPIRKWRLYEASFWARASGNTTMRLSIEQDHEPCDKLGLDEEVQIGANWKKFAFTFHAPGEDESVRVRLSAPAGAGTECEFARVSFKDVGVLHPKSGLYAIWYWHDNFPDVFEKIPWLTGGQLVYLWGDLESKTKAGAYDFSAIKRDLQDFVKRGQHTTLQINGHRHPSWFFDHVPYYNQPLDRRVEDKKGTLRYWHPNYIRESERLLECLGHFLNGRKQDGSGPDPHAVTPRERDAIVGIRMNFNPIDTEPFTPEDRPMPSEDDPGWVVPAKAGGLGPAWDEIEARLTLETAVFEAHRKYLAPVFVLARAQYFREKVSDYDEPPEPRFAAGLPDLEEREKTLERGEMGLMRTGLAIEARDQVAANHNRLYSAYARTGKTFAFTETVHGPEYGKPPSGRRFPRLVSPNQWTWWCILCALNDGTSFISARPQELKLGLETTEDGKETLASLNFARKYAGYHAAPTVSPGAWVAMREGSLPKGDYTCLMKRLEDDESIPLPPLPAMTDRNFGTVQYSVGPEEQRHGAWARKIPANGQMRLDLDDAFARSLDDQAAKVRVVYLDDASTGKFTVHCSGAKFTQDLQKSYRWREVNFDLPYAAFHPVDEHGADLLILTDADLTLHMIEVQREKPIPVHRARTK